MVKKRSRKRKYIRRSAHNCDRTWSPAQRLAHYSKPDPLSGCHIWHGFLKEGYGRLYFGHKMHLAHRLAWEVKHGPIPKGLVVRHRCNVRRCCNPDHMVLGTRAENNADTKAEYLRLADAPRGDGTIAARRHAQPRAHPHFRARRRDEGQSRDQARQS